MKWVFLFVFITLFSCGISFADKNVNLDLTTTYEGCQQLADSDLYASYGWYNLLQLNAHLVVAPSMNMGSDNLQPDALLDVFVNNQNSTNGSIIKADLREAYIDLLYYSSLSLKTGFVRYDYGSLNSWYNPLNIVELINLQDIYSEIMIGNTKQGNVGLPSIQLRYSLPEFLEDMKLSMEEDLIAVSLTNLQNDFYITKLEGIYLNMDLALLMSYNLNSWSSGTNRFRPVIGTSLSICLPFNIMFFGELVYKSQSFRAIVDNEGYAAIRYGDFFDLTAKASYTFQEPFFQNVLSTSLEYFHYGEGMNFSQYEKGYQYISMNGGMGLTNPANALFFRMDRDLQDYLYYTLTYNFVVQKVTISYALDVELESSYLQHTLTFSKQYDSVQLGLSIVYNQASNMKYAAVFMNKDCWLFLQASLSI